MERLKVQDYVLGWEFPDFKNAREFEKDLIMQKTS